MNIDFLQYFVDPATHEPLVLEDAVYENEDIISGRLRSASNSYPIINGIPRFVPVEKNYAKSFGYQWNKWKRIQFDSENTGNKMAGYTKMMWEKISDMENDETSLQGKIVLDIGCGPGRFIEIARKKGAKVIGLDYSSAVEAARENFKSDPGTCIIQADALKLPIASGILDAAYTIGVLHHTPDPKAAVGEATRALKKDGWFSISVYAKGGYYDKAFVQAWRKLFNFLWPVFKQYPPLIYTYVVMILFWPIGRAVPFLGKLIRQMFPYVNLPNWRWSMLDTFDSLTPSYQSAHESYEVFRWFKDNGFTKIEPTDWSFTAYKGVK